MLISFHNHKKVEKLKEFFSQAETIADIEQYERAVKRLTDRGKLSKSDAEKLNRELKIRRAIIK